MRATSSDVRNVVMTSLAFHCIGFRVASRSFARLAMARSVAVGKASGSHPARVHRPEPRPGSRLTGALAFPQTHRDESSRPSKLGRAGAKKPLKSKTKSKALAIF